MTSREYHYHRRKKFKLFTMHHVFQNLRARCPVCSAKLTVQADSWELDKWGWVAMNLDVQCNNEPDMEDETGEWEEWMIFHFSTPYEDWLPFTSALLKQFQKKIRFINPKKTHHAKSIITR